jgi:cytochrome c-type biogenesis protein CcmF
VISSVHSFTQSRLGPFFIGFLVFAILVAGALVVYRLPELRTKGTIESFFSREAAFLFNNLILVGIAFAVFWGTVFPVLSEWVRGVKITVGPPFFNRVNAPLGVVLLFLMGVGPVIAWRRATPKNLWRAFAAPVGSGLAAAIVLLLLGTPLGYAYTTFALGAFVLGTIVQEFWRGMRARQALLKESAPQALAHVVGKNRRRYGGYVIHVGIVMAFVGVAASSVFRIEVQQTLSQGQDFQVGRYRLRFDRIENREDGHMAASAAVLSVFVGDRQIDTLKPEKRFYKKPKQPTTEVANRSTLREDLYVVLGSYDPQSKLATILAYVNPLVVWIWLGGLVAALGTAIAVWPSAAERRVEVAIPDRAATPA